jgi:protein TonB
MLGLLLLTAVSEAPAQSGAALPKPIQPEKWISYTDYPVSALSNDKVGTTWFELSVDETGKPFSCRTILSSGTVELDRKSCAAMMVRGRFEPARDEQGRAIAGTIRRATSWSMPPREPKKPEMPADLVLPVSRLPSNAKPSVILRLVETADGVVENCEIEKSSGSPQLDRLGCAAVSKEKMPQPLIGPDGVPVRAVRVRRIEFRATQS